MSHFWIDCDTLYGTREQRTFSGEQDFMKTRVILCSILSIIVTASAYALRPGVNASLTINTGVINQQTETACGTATANFSFTSNGPFSSGNNVRITQVSGSCVTFTVLEPGSFSWSGSAAVTANGAINVENVNLSGSYLIVGSIFPKYQILGVDYAPPGAKSTVVYNAGYIQGTSTTNASTFSSGDTLSVKLDFGGPIGRLVGTDLNAGVSGSYTQEQDTSNQDSVNITTSLGETVPGPISSSVGIDHSNDIIWVWLNPGVNISIPSPNSIVVNGYGYNAADPLNEMDIIFLYVGWLQNPSTMPSDVASRLARTWDTSGVGSLTTADYTSILAADPFVGNPSFNPNTDTTDRFTLAGGQNFDYEPAGAGEQPVPQSFTFTTQNISTNTMSTKDTRSVSASITAQLGAFVFFNSVTNTYTYTSTSQWTKVVTDTTNQMVTISITPPAATDNYTGPTAIQCWRDNIYGSYMFFAAQ